MMKEFWLYPPTKFWFYQIYTSDINIISWLKKSRTFSSEWSSHKQQKEAKKKYNYNFIIQIQFTNDWSLQLCVIIANSESIFTRIHRPRTLRFDSRQSRREKLKILKWNFQIEKRKEKKEREIKRTSETPIFLNEQPWNKFEPLPSDRTAARHHRRNLCRTIRRHFRNCSGAFLNFRRKSKVTRPCGQFQGSAYVWHVPRSLSRIFQPLQLQGWREAERRWWRKRIPSLSLLLLLLLSLYHSSSICAALRRSMKLVNRTWSPWPRVDQS